MRSSLGVGLAWLLGGACAAGCGLTLDYDPPDPDAAGGRFDGGGLDAGSIDAGRSDAGQGACTTERDCADDDLCNGIELCVAGRCVAGDPVHCPDTNVCDGVDACEPSTGQCVSSEPLACPSDGDPCNGIESCDPVIGCTHSPPLDCDDGIDCTIDACGPDGCVHSGDDTRCNAATGGTCTPLGCDYPTCIEGVTCIADNPCMTAVCSGGTCVRGGIACSGGTQCCGGVCVPLGCDDGEPCTDDACDMATGCMHSAHLGACDDGNACTGSDFCAGGRCTPGSLIACPTSGQCSAARCDPTGGCTTMPTSGNPCTDGNACTTGDACSSGTCLPGSGSLRCDDANPCTQDSCSPSAGCVAMPVSDGVTCVLAGTVGTCVGGLCGTSMCPVGFADCDNDGSCECMGTCSTSGGPVTCSMTMSTDCVMTGCSGGQVCCTVGLSSGHCYDPTCLACCMP